MELLTDIKNSIEYNQSRNAFCINRCYYSYKELAKKITAIRQLITKNISANNNIIGLITNDDLETYASIIAIWLEGKAYVPLNPNFPSERNNAIIKSAEINIILNSSIKPQFTNYTTIKTKNVGSNFINLEPINYSKSSLAYIFFTSGTTGTPKGVPITFKNLTSFLNAFSELNYSLSNQDKCLQMFELTFDLSVFSFLTPIISGACTYTIPPNEIKYSYIFELIEDYKITYTLMVPSILQFLRPYFSEINFTSIRYSLFCGEALPLDITNEWSKCVPNATIANLYGPTECTIFCTNYTYNKNNNNKTHNGILTIGKEMKNTIAIIIDQNNNEVNLGQKGELCLSGDQLTPGYWKNETKNKEAFFIKKYKGKTSKFYKTGDLCYKDENENILFIGRVDFQTKIQGFRVELSEIEYHVKKLLNKINVIAIALTNHTINSTEIGLVIQAKEFNTTQLLKNLRKKVPEYMMPTKIKFLKSFPLNNNGKVDRNKLKNCF
jgi:amino acid adenylation domain-containing protein